MTEERYWENWDKGNVAQVIDALWLERENGWREDLVEDIKRCLGVGVPLLDVGCGTGLVCQKMLQREVITKGTYIGGDVSKKLVEIAKHRLPEFNFMDLDIFNLPFADRSQKNVICIHVLQHLPSYEEAIKELMRVVSEKLYITTWFNLTGKDELNFKSFEALENNSFQSNCYSLSKFLIHIKDTYHEIKSIWINNIDSNRNYTMLINLK